MRKLVPVRDEIRQATRDDGVEEAWERETDDPDILGIDATKITVGAEPYWAVTVAVAEFLRDDALGRELRQRMAAALASVDGAGNVWEDDTEVWGVTGTPSGQALIRAAASVVDDIAPSARAYLDSL